MDQHIEDLFRDGRAADKIDRERIELFEALVRSPGWLAYISILEAKLQMFADQVLSPAGSVDGMVTLEYVKGTMSGLVIARDIPSVTIAAKDQIRSKPVNTEIDDDDDL